MIRKTMSIATVMLAFGAAMWIADIRGLSASPRSVGSDAAGPNCRLLGKQRPQSQLQGLHLRMQSWQCDQQ